MQAFEALLESAIATPAEDSSSLSRSSSRKTKAASAATGHVYRALRLRGSGEGWASQLLGRAMSFITQFFESSQFSSETKQQQQQQQQAVSFRCNFAQRVAKMAATAILPSAGVGA